MIPLLTKLSVILGLLGVALAQTNEMTLTPQIDVYRANLGALGAIYEHFSPDKIEVALKIADCESKLNPLATNSKSSAKGLYQILRGTWKHFSCSGDPFNAEDNVRCAVKIAEKDWSDWNASKKCWSN